MNPFNNTKINVPTSTLAAGLSFFKRITPSNKEDFIETAPLFSAFITYDALAYDALKFNVPKDANSVSLDISCIQEYKNVFVLTANRNIIYLKLDSPNRFKLKLHDIPKEYRNQNYLLFFSTENPKEDQIRVAVKIGLQEESVSIQPLTSCSIKSGSIYSGAEPFSA